ncbi:MAG: aconitate hydratase AcnA [Pseudomonadota bacterium]
MLHIGESGARLIDLPSLLAARVQPLPKSLMIVAENLARQALRDPSLLGLLEDVVAWSPDKGELVVPLKPSRILLPDSSGLPALMDLAAARDAVAGRGTDPKTINPLTPTTLVIDHSLIVDLAGHPNAQKHNIALEFERNAERYSFFKWAEQAFDNLQVVPPGAGIIHQIHLEALARVVDVFDTSEGPIVGPEFVLGCDSHTPMVNGIGLLAWGVGGIDGEAAALGQPYTVRIPKVVGVRLSGKMPVGATTTDLVLTLTERLRAVGVVGAFVEYFGPGVAELTVPERATIANMAPEYGATVGYFPMDRQTFDYLRQSGRDDAHVKLVEDYAHRAGLVPEGPENAVYSHVIEVDLSGIQPSIAGPRRPQDRIPLNQAKSSFRSALSRPVADNGFGLKGADIGKTIAFEGRQLTHGALTIAAITSCTNTSNPSVMIGAGLLARNAVARGLGVPPWVKTSLAPGSRLVQDYLADVDLMPALEALGFHVVGFGCTTCSGKSGPIDPVLAEGISGGNIVAASVLSGNRNFEGRIHKSTRANYLASPPLVVAFALAGRIDVDFESEPLGKDNAGEDVYLRDIWPDPGELETLVATTTRPDRFRKSYATLFDGSELWTSLDAPTGARFAWNEGSTYVRRPPFFDRGHADLPDRLSDARVLIKCGDSLTTDHVTPSGEILPDSQAGAYLMAQGVAPEDFNAVTQRRGNHEFMARVTFANQRMKNHLAGGVEGGFTRLVEDGELMTVYDAAEAMQGTPLMVLAGKDYGMGSSRDWAAKGPALLGVRIILAESFERIHRANLIGVGIVPLVFPKGMTAQQLKLTGFETYSFVGLKQALREGDPVSITAVSDQETIVFHAYIDIASTQEATLLQSGGMFQNLLKSSGQEGETAWAK